VALTITISVAGMRCSWRNGRRASLDRRGRVKLFILIVGQVRNERLKRIEWPYLILGRFDMGSLTNIRQKWRSALIGVTKGTRDTRNGLNHPSPGAPPRRGIQSI
jgi:hypothetical protein